MKFWTPSLTPHLSTQWYARAPLELRENVQWRRELLEQARKDPQFRTDLRKMAAEDLLFWLTAFGWTYNPRPKKGGRGKLKIPFLPWVTQTLAFSELMRALGEQRDAAFSKSRDMGASWILVAWLYWLWQHYPFMAFLLVSRKEWLVDGNDSSLFAKLDFLRESQPVWMQPKCKRIKLRLVNLRNKSFINGETTTESIARGDRYTVIGLDEFGEMKGAELILSATADATNTRVFNSTPTGTHHPFYERTKNEETVQVRLHWSSHPDKAAGLYRPRKDGSIEILDKDYDFTGYAFQTEIPRSLEGVRSPWYDEQVRRRKHAIEVAVQLDIDFQGASYKFFGDQLLEVLKESTREPDHVGELVPIGQGQGRYEFVPGGGECQLKLWFTPFHGQPPGDEEYILAADISMGTGASNSVCSVVSRFSGCKVAELVGNTIPIPRFARMCIELARWFNNGELTWERPGPGEIFAIEIQQIGYSHLWRWRDTTRQGSKVSDKAGWFSNGDQKGHLLTTYREALRDGRIINPCIESIKEAGQYVFEAGKIIHDSRLQDDADDSDLGNNHGDRCIADALATLVLVQRGGHVADGEPPKRPEPPARIGSLGWRHALAAAEEAQRNED